MSSPTTQEQISLRLAVLERTAELLTAALSLVAALAWNDAIQALFRSLFGEAGSLYAKFLYALIITALIVFFTTRLTRLTESVRKKLVRVRE